MNYVQLTGLVTKTGHGWYDSTLWYNVEKRETEKEYNYTQAFLFIVKKISNNKKQNQYLKMKNIR